MWRAMVVLVVSGGVVSCGDKYVRDSVANNGGDVMWRAVVVSGDVVNGHQINYICQIFFSNMSAVFHLLSHVPLGRCTCTLLSRG